MTHTKRTLEQLKIAEDSDVLSEEQKERNRERIRELKAKIEAEGDE